jgi:hypothetical protein
MKYYELYQVKNGKIHILKKEDMNYKCGVWYVSSDEFLGKFGKQVISPSISKLMCKRCLKAIKFKFKLEFLPEELFEI